MSSGRTWASGKVQDTYMNTQDPASSELVDREQRYQNAVGGSFDYAPGGGNFYLSAQEAKEYGLVDEVIASTKDLAKKK